MKKILIVFLAIVLVAIFALTISVLNSSKIPAANYNIHPDKVIPLSKYSDESFIRGYVLKHIPEGAKLIGINREIVYFNDRRNSSEPLPANPIRNHNFLGIQWSFPHYYIANVSRLYEAWTTPCIAEFVGNTGPTTIHMSQSTTISNFFDANVDISAKVVSAGVGFSVTAKHTVPLTNSISIPSGKSGAIEVYPIYEIYDYDVMHKAFSGPSHKIGKGRAGRAVGIFYLTYIWSEQ